MYPVQPPTFPVTWGDAGFDAVDVRDVGLRGKSDAEVFDDAQRENRLLIT